MSFPIDFLFSLAQSSISLSLSVFLSFTLYPFTPLSILSSLLHSDGIDATALGGGRLRVEKEVKRLEGYGFDMSDFKEGRDWGILSFFFSPLSGCALLLITSAQSALSFPPISLTNGTCCSQFGHDARSLW